MRKYDEIVVGSGVSGLTLSLLLGMHGRKVLLLEKAPFIGGSLARFKRKGIPLDTGFHFTGGFGKDGILTQMLEVLDMDDAIEPDRISRPEDNRFVLEDDNKVFDMPVEFPELVKRIKEIFPDEVEAIDQYFELCKSICANTVSMNLKTITDMTQPAEEDYISLQDMLNLLTSNKELQTLLASYSLCYGTEPTEISFANHCRVAYSMYESIARVKHGGGAFIDAFSDKLSKYNVEIQCNTTIESCSEIKNKLASGFILNTGEEITADNCIFTIHPSSILDILPRENISKAFISRVEHFDPSVGFFSLYAAIEESDEIEDFSAAVISFIPSSDPARLFDQSSSLSRPMVMMRNREEVDGKFYNVLNAFELSFPSDVQQWSDSKHGSRPADYIEYKTKHVESIKRRIFELYPEYEKHFTLLDSASMLSFKDYLHTPFGCAYGIKQKIGQMSLFGRLPVRNIYAAGQSSVLPGVVGSMMSSFILARTLIGKDTFKDFIDSELK